jgi:crotonyl-CoA carboxylase/reductase
MLFGHAPHVVRPGSNVLVWGAGGGLGSMAIQLTRLAGGNAIAVIGDESKRAFVTSLGAAGVINRKAFDCWGCPPSPEQPAAYEDYLRKARRFGAEVRKLTGGNDVDIVFEHPGMDTFAVSCMVCKRAGMIVFCASTSGFGLFFDSRFVWTRQKRIQGSHFANRKQASEANSLVRAAQLQPCLGEAFAWEQLPEAHVRMLENRHSPGNHVVRVGARSAHALMPATGCRVSYLEGARAPTLSAER